MLRPAFLVLTVVVACVPASLAAEGRAELPPWVADRLVDAGHDVDARDVRVVRTTLAAGQAHVGEVPFSALPQDDPFAWPAAAAPAPVDDVVVGEMTQHIMYQVGGCAGYEAQQAAPGLVTIQDAAWTAGAHLARGPLAGGMAASTGGDPAANLVLIAATDSGMSLAAGEMTIREDRLVLFGHCLILLGTLTGTGVWDFT